MYSRKKKRGVNWYGDFTIDGVRYTPCYGMVSKSVAKERERKLRNEIASGKYERKSERIEFESFVVKYLREKKLHNKPGGYLFYIASVKPLVKFFRGKKLVVIKGEKEGIYRFDKIQGGRERIKYLSDIYPFMVQKFKQERKQATKGEKTKKEISGATVNRSLKCLGNMFKLAKKWRMAKENPVEEIDRFKEKPDDAVVLSRDEETRFFQALKHERQAVHMNAIALLALYTGMRKREILDLEKNRVHFKKQVLTLVDTKNGEKREVPLTEALTKALEEAINKSPKDNPYVFPSPRTGKPYTDVRRSFATAMKKVGFDHYKFHWLRHSFALRMAEAGLDRDTIKEIGGWKSDSMVSRYTHPSMEHKRRAIEKIQHGVPSILPSLDETEHLSNLTTTLNGDNIKAI